MARWYIVSSIMFRYMSNMFWFYQCFCFVYVSHLFGIFPVQNVFLPPDVQLVLVIRRMRRILKIRKTRMIRNWSRLASESPPVAKEKQTSRSVTLEAPLTNFYSCANLPRARMRPAEATPSWNAVSCTPGAYSKFLDPPEKHEEPSLSEIKPNKLSRYCVSEFTGWTNEYNV